MNFESGIKFELFILKGLTMPFVNIRITKENGTPTLEQKKELIDGVTNLLAKVLNKNKASTVVIIDEIDTDNYGLGGKTVKEIRQGG